MDRRPVRAGLPGAGVLGSRKGGSAPMNRGRRGNMVLEALLWIPILTTMIVGMIQVGKITYLYYSLKKTVYSAARFLATAQGVNFCDPADPNTVAAFQFAITGTTDGSG